MILFQKIKENIFKHPKATVLILFVVCCTIIYRNQKTNLDNMIENEKIVKICLNRQYFTSEIAIWTFLTDDIGNYSIGAIKLLKSIKKNTIKTKFDAFVLELANKPIPNLIKAELERGGWKFCRVNRIAPRDEQKTFGRFRDQFTKLLLWNATEHEAHYYFDSDTFVIRNIDEFLNTHKKFDSNLHKIGCTMDIRASVWQKTFNFGVFVLKPNLTEFTRLIELKSDQNLQFEMSMSEQGFLNVVYKNLWYEIGFENNANLAVYSQKRDFWDGKENFINIIHYTMEKPWACSDTYKIPCNYWRNFN